MHTVLSCSTILETYIPCSSDTVLHILVMSIVTILTALAIRNRMAAWSQCCVRICKVRTSSTNLQLHILSDSIKYKEVSLSHGMYAITWPIPRFNLPKSRRARRSLPLSSSSSCCSNNLQANASLIAIVRWSRKCHNDLVMPSQVRPAECQWSMLGAAYTYQCSDKTRTVSQSGPHAVGMHMQDKQHIPTRYSMSLHWV